MDGGAEAPPLQSKGILPLITCPRLPVCGDALCVFLFER
jgi:hypothetical protein